MRAFEERPLLWLCLPVLFAFPILYRSHLLGDMRKPCRVGLLVLISYSVFAGSAIIWFVIAMAIAALIVLAGGSFG